MSVGERIELKCTYVLVRSKDMPLLNHSANRAIWSTEWHNGIFLYNEPVSFRAQIVAVPTLIYGVGK